MLLAFASTALLILPTSALSASVAPAAAPAAASPTAAAAPADPARDEHATRASDYYARGRFVEASLEFEGLWQDYPKEPRFLFNAAASRYAAQHYAHTVRYLEDYLARSEVQGADRQEAQAQFDEARKKVTSVGVAVSVPAGVTDEVKLSVRHVARGASDLRPPLEYSTRPASGVAREPVQLEPGKWVVRAEAPGHTPAEQEITVTNANGQSVELRLVAAPVAPPPTTIVPTSEGVPPATARKLKIGFAVGGGVTAAIGVGVLVAGVVRRSNVSTCEEGKIGECKSELKLGLRTRDAGFGVVGGGLGLLAGGLIWSAKDAQTRRKAWIAGAAIGGVAIVGGYVGLLLSSRPFNVANTGPIAADAWSAHHGGVGKAGAHAATSAILGLGVGLLASSITGLIVQKRHRKPRSAALRSLQLDGAASPRLTGLVLSGRF